MGFAGRGWDIFPAEVRREKVCVRGGGADGRDSQVARGDGRERRGEEERQRGENCGDGEPHRAETPTSSSGGPSAVSGVCGGAEGGARPTGGQGTWLAPPRRSRRALFILPPWLPNASFLANGARLQYTRPHALRSPRPSRSTKRRRMRCSRMRTPLSGSCRRTQRPSARRTLRRRCGSCRRQRPRRGVEEERGNRGGRREDWEEGARKGEGVDDGALDRGKCRRAGGGREEGCC